jgi:phosphotransferase system enzyme I (PtsI)
MNEIRLEGIAASDGIAIGPAYCLILPDLTIPCRDPEPFEKEMTRFIIAVEQARQELQSLEKLLIQRASEKEAEIFRAHQMMLDDPMLVMKVRKTVERGQIVEQAIISSTDELSDLLAGMDDELFAARAMDVKDVGKRVLRILLGQPEMALCNMGIPSIILAHDLTPSDTANLDPKLTIGFCTAAGGLTSHSAILARTLGIPAIVALGGDLMKTIPTGTPLVMDGKEGTLILRPTIATTEKYQRIQQEREEHLARIKAVSMQPTHTANHRRVEVAANIGDIASARNAVQNGAEGVGLLRTEFLYLDEVRPPSEDKQFQIYKKILEVMGQLPVIVRTLDIGGDKPPSYVKFPREMNPFLGWRAIRISLDQPELFKTQLRAILRAAVNHNVRIMLPMVSDLDELRRARNFVEDAKAELSNENIPYNDHVPIGIMVETPAAAMLVDVLSEASDFFSLGTNDLTQYTLAVDRGNAAVAGLYQPLHPSVLRLIKQTIDMAHNKGKWVGMCGELAGMQKAIPILLGMGLDEFSMNPRAIPEAKQLIRHLEDEKASQIAKKALSLGTASEIESLMLETLKEL